MAFCVKKFVKSFKNQNHRKIFKYLPDSRSQLISPGQHLTIHMKYFATPPDFILNRKSELTDALPIYSSNMKNHHLAKNILMCDVGGTHVFSRNYAKDKKNTPVLDNISVDFKINKSQVNAKLKTELDRLRRKGVMGAIAIKKPEDTINGGQR